MKDSSVAKVYAQSIYDIAKEKNIDMAKELTFFTEIINSSNNLENLLFLDIFSPDEKLAVLNELATKIELNELTQNFVKFLVQEKRTNLLPLIIKEVIVTDDHERGFLRGTIEGSEDTLDAEVRNRVVTFLKQKLGKEPILDYQKNSDISAGYKITVEDLQLDASLENQLNRFKETVINNTL